MVGAVGTDANAAVALGRMSSVAVDRTHVQEVPGPTGLAIVAVDSRGENSIIVVPGANGSVNAAFIDRASEVIAARTSSSLRGRFLPRAQRGPPS